MTKKYNYSFEKSNDMHIINISDENDNFIMKCEYAVAGSYNLSSSVWYWSWSIDYIDKELTIDLEPVREFKNKLVDNSTKYDQKQSDQLYFYLSNNNFYLSYENINILLKMVLYLTKGLWIFPVKIANDQKNNLNIKRIEFVLIKKILQNK